METVIGICGVGLLLVAFILNIFRKLSESSRCYLLMNFVGAGLAAWYAWMGGVIPFVVLEGVWGLVALVKLVLSLKRTSISMS